jgi:ArsR family transcriptional regulator, arsenate/arsenite/antimonite-responsive transcriptional repressor
MVVDRPLAERYAAWFRCLGDATRIQILSLLASQRHPLTVQQIVAALDVGQPTVSHHVKQLEHARFVICERHGASTLVRVNRRCVDAFPTAASFVMGRVRRERVPFHEAA